MAAGDRAGQPERRRGDHGFLVPAQGHRRFLVADQPAGQLAGPAALGPAGTGQRRHAAHGHRQRRPALPAAGPGQDTGRDGGDDLAAGQPRSRRPRPVLCRVRQPDPGAGGQGRWPAELGDRWQLVSLAAADLGRCPGRGEPGVARGHLDPAGRPDARAVAPARRWLPAAARRLGAVQRPRGGGHRVRARGAAHDRRGFAAELLGQRAPVPRPAGRPGSGRVRQQRITPPGPARRGQRVRRTAPGPWRIARIAPGRPAPGRPRARPPSLAPAQPARPARQAPTRRTGRPPRLGTTRIVPRPAGPRPARPPVSRRSPDRHPPAQPARRPARTTGHTRRPAARLWPTRPAARPTSRARPARRGATTGTGTDPGRAAPARPTWPPPRAVRRSPGCLPPPASTIRPGLHMPRPAPASSTSPPARPRRMRRRRSRRSSTRWPPARSRRSAATGYPPR